MLDKNQNLNNRTILMDDGKMLDVNKVEKFLQDRANNSNGNVNEQNYLDRLMLRENPEIKFIETQYGLIRADGDFYLKDDQNLVAEIGSSVLGTIDVASNFVKGVRSGIVGALAGAASIPISVGEKYGLLEEETLKEFGEKVDAYRKENINDNTAGIIGDVVGQFVAPGVAYYKLFSAALKTLPIAGKFGNALKNSTIIKTALSEVATVGTVQTPTDPNFFTLIEDLTGVDNKLSRQIGVELFKSMATPGEWNPNNVLDKKLNAIVVDATVVVGAPRLIIAGFPLLISFAKQVHKLKADGLITLGVLTSSTLEETVPEETVPEETVLEETVPEEIITENNITEESVLEDNSNTEIPLEKPLNIKVIEPLNIRVIEQIKEREGFLAEAKKFDGEPFYTIGYGRSNSSVKKGDTVTREEAEEYLIEDINIRIPKINSLLPKLNEYSNELQEALFYEFYRGSLGASVKTMNLINEGNFKEAAIEFLNHDEYRKAIEENENPGIIKTMGRVANALNSEGKK